MFFGDTKDLEAASEWKVHPTGREALVITPRSGYVLTSGSDLNQFVAPTGDMQNPWPWTFSAAVRRMFGNWRANNKVEVYHRNTPANFGGHGSIPHYSFRHGEYNEDSPYGGFGGYPTDGSLRPNPGRPTYNNLVPVVYGIRDIELTAQAASAELVQIPTIPLGPVDYTPGGTASLQETLL